MPKRKRTPTTTPSGMKTMHAFFKTNGQPEAQIRMLPEKNTTQAATLLAVGVTFLALRWFWNKKKLDRKLERKRIVCRRTIEFLERELEENKLPTEKKVAILLLSLSELQSKLQSGELLAQDVLRAYQEKALKVNKKINCITEVITEAEMEAAKLDDLKDKSRTLHGVPLSLKENIGLKGYDTSAGMQINIDNPCEEDAVVVQVFKRHGAVPFIRTNVPQAMLSYTCSNPIFGTTLNPFSLTHTPGGSSGGEGAVLGAGGSIIGLGTDVGGSVRAPASFCGICALKPTFGRFSKIGSYSVVDGQTQIAAVVGPLAQDVNSLIVMTRIMASPDMFELDPALPPLPFQEELLKSKHKLKIGYFTWDGNLRPQPVVCRAVHAAKKALEDLGHTLVEFTPPDYHGCNHLELYTSTIIGGDQGQTLKSKMKDDYLDIGLQVIKTTKLPRWILCLLAKLFSMKESVVGKVLRCIKSDGDGEGKAARERRWIPPSQCWLKRSEVSNALLPYDQKGYRKQFTQHWKSLGLDAVICPAFVSPAPLTSCVGRVTVAGSMCMLYNVVNYPAGVVPVTTVTARDVADVNNPTLYPKPSVLETLLKKSCSEGLPVGVQCVTLPFKEELCLRVMSELEAAVNFKPAKTENMNVLDS